MRLLFLLAVFLSSSLLFLVEPLAARLILPTFGGSPQVWNTSLVFFQGVLLLGYTYAHATSKWLNGRTQRAVHLGLGLFALVALPMSTHSAWFEGIRLRASGSAPAAPLVLLALVGLVGLPFFVLSAQSSLLQRWFSSSGDRDSGSPYFLYAAGNVGSMLALLAYPLWVEPALRLSKQTSYWSFGYVALIALVGLCAFVTRPLPHEEASASVEPIASRTRLKWLALSAVPSSLLLGVTTFLTSNVAPIPLLWVVPLALYLATFILVFARRPWTPSRILGRIYPMLLIPLALMIVLESDRPLVPLASLHLIVFFVAAWMCHSRLSESRPDPVHLTEFYFWIALGGVLGGTFNAFVAPLIFNTWADYPLALVAAALLRPRIEWPTMPTTPIHRKIAAMWRARNADYVYPIAVALITVALVLVVQLGPSLRAHHMVPGIEPGPFRTFLDMGIPVVFCFAAALRPVRFGLSCLAFFMVSGALHSASDGQVILSERTFFGVHRVLVEHEGRTHKLVHGNTIHGIQDLTHPSLPLTYYYPNGPIGQVMSVYHPPRAALVGLGVGSLAAYGVPGQQLTYFEIDPTVARIASSPEYFTFLRDSKAKVKIVLGDARLTLARSPEHYGLIVLDAFSSDAIPVHLLTVEAMQIYLDHLEPGGLLAFHISNRYLELEPILSAAARDLHLVGIADIDVPLENETLAGKTESHWVLIARNKADFKHFHETPDWAELEDPARRAWTDDYSNVLGAFHGQE